jgi:hypothetical protein
VQMQAELNLHPSPSPATWLRTRADGQIDWIARAEYARPPSPTTWLSTRLGYRTLRGTGRCPGVLKSSPIIPNAPSVDNRLSGTS